MVRTLLIAVLTFILVSEELFALNEKDSLARASSTYSIDADDPIDYRKLTFFKRNKKSGKYEQVKESTNEKLQAGDPLYFSLFSSKNPIKLGEEIEVTVTVNYPQVSPSSFFSFDEWLAYELHVLLPDGFILTEGELDVTGRFEKGSYGSKSYTLKGFFEYAPSNALIQLIRGIPEGGGDQIFTKKSELFLVFFERNFSESYSRNLRAACDFDISISEGNTCGFFAGDPIFSVLIDDGCTYNLEPRAPSTDLSGLNVVRYTENGQHRDELSLDYGVTKSLSIYIPNLVYYNFDNYSANSHLPTIEPSVNKRELLLNENALVSVNKQDGVCENAQITWVIQAANPTDYLISSPVSGNGVNSINVKFTQPGKYGVRYKCINNCGQERFSPLTYLTASSTSVQSITISSNDKDICVGEATSIQVTQNSCIGSFTWYKDGSALSVSQSKNLDNLTELGTYKARCDNNGAYSNEIPITRAYTVSKPKLEAGSTSISVGGYTTISATGCSGTITWSKPNNETASGNSTSALYEGYYYATCTSACGTSEPGKIYIKVTDLLIKKDKEYCVYSGEAVVLTAHGCTSGAIEWTVSGAKVFGNPITVYNPGTINAKCIKGGGASFTQASTEICGLSPNAVTISKSRDFTSFSNPSILTAHGCTTGTVEWHYFNGTNNYATGNTISVLYPVYYTARCKIGTTYGPAASVYVPTEPPSYISFVANKTSVKQGEAVILQQVGSCSGLTRYTLPNGSSFYATSQNTTVYGPGTYKIQCIAVDMSSSTPFEKTINESVMGSIGISASRNCARAQEMVHFVSTGCEYTTKWITPDGSIRMGNEMDYFGSGIYKAACVSQSGQTGTFVEKEITFCSSNVPLVKTSGTSIAGDEPTLLVLECTGSRAWLNPDGSSYWPRDGEAHIALTPGTYQYYCSSLPNVWTPLVINEPSAGSIIIKSNKPSANASESVTLTASGCNYGTVKWKVGSNYLSGNSITVTGPGNYEAWCEGDLLNNGNHRFIQIFEKTSIVPTLADNIKNRACPNEPVLLSATCESGYSVQWQSIIPGMQTFWEQNRNSIDNNGNNYYGTYQINWGGTMTKNGPGIYWARCYKNDGSWYGDFYKTVVLVNKAFPEYFEATSNSSNEEVGLCGSENTLKLGATYIDGVSYSWTGPASFTGGSRSVEIPEAGFNRTGLYTVTATRNYTGGSCSTTATTNVVLRNEVPPTIDAITSNSPINRESILLLEVDTDEDLEVYWEGPMGFTSNEKSTGWLVDDLNQGGIYKVRVIDVETGCESEGSVDVEVLDFVQLKKVVLGNELPNPYTIGNVNEALSCLRSGMVSVPTSIPSTLEANYNYKRFKPSDEEQYTNLIYDPNLAVYDYPLNYEILESGQVYQDPNLSNGNYNWLYAVVSVDDTLAFGGEEEIIEPIFLPFGNGVDPSPEYNTEETQFYKRLEKASEMLVNGSSQNARSVKSCSNIDPSSLDPCNDECIPSGRIRVLDDFISFNDLNNTYIQNQPGIIPVPGAKVRVRKNLFVSRDVITDEAGFFEFENFEVDCDKKLKFSIIWDREDFNIRTVNYGVAKYVEKDVVNCEWNVDLNRSFNEQFLYAHVHRAAWDYYYNNTFGVRTPPGASFLGKINLGVRSTNSTNPTNRAHFFQFNQLFLSSEIKLPFHVNFDSEVLFSTTIHELTHATHWQMGMTYQKYCNNDNHGGRIAESWADVVEWHVSNIVYGLNEGANQGVTLENIQRRGSCTRNGPYYTPLFIDLIDNVNQSQMILTTPNDQAAGFTIQELEDFLELEPSNWFNLRQLILNSNNQTRENGAALFDLYIPQN